MIWGNFWRDTAEEPGMALIFLGLAGAFLITGFFISRKKTWLAFLLPILLCAGGLIGADYWIFSPKEKARLAIEECAAAVGANQKAALFPHIAPELASEVKAKIDWAFTQADFYHAYSNDIKLEMNEFTSPPSIQATFFAGVRFRAKSGIIPADRWNCVMTLTFEEFEDGNWLITDYETRPIFSGGNP